MSWSLFLIKLQASRPATLLKRDSNTDVFLWILQTLRTTISKNICERLLLLVVIYCIENWIKLLRNQMGILFLLKHKITLFYLLSSVFIRFDTSCHSPSLIIIFCYSLSFVVTRCQSLSFVATCCTTRCHLSRDVTLVCLFDLVICLVSLLCFCFCYC